MRLLNSIATMTAVAALALLPSVAAAQASQTSAAPQAKTAQKRIHRPMKPARPAVAKAAAPAGGANPEVKQAVARRDPFQSLLFAAKDQGANLPPGKAGLVIATIRVDGAIKSPTGMIAVVSNPQQRVYFVREGDRLYDGEVEKINLDEVIFRESTKDAFGKPVEREVTKRLYASAGEQQ